MKDCKILIKIFFCMMVCYLSSLFGLATTSNAFFIGHDGPPANDNFTYSRLLLGETGSIYDDNYRTTAQPGEPNHGDGLPTANCSIWFSWTAPQSR